MTDLLSKFRGSSFLSLVFRPFSSGGASVLLVLATLISYVAGLLRDILLSNYFGATGLTDAYNTSFWIPDMIYTLTTAGALSGIFLPIFRSIELKDKEEGARLAGSFLVLSQVLVLTVSVLAFIFMPWLIETFFQQADPLQVKDIVNMSRILLLSPIIFTISNTFGSILITFKHYLAYAFSAAFYNVGIIAGILLLHERFGIYSAVIGVVVGLSFHFGLRLIDFSKLDFKFNFVWWNPGIRKIIKLAVPKTFGLLVWQLSLWAYNAIGYGLVAGSISAFYYARNIQSFAVSLFGIALATSVFPFIVDLKEEGKTTELISKIESAFLQILVFTVPSAVGLALLDEEVVTVLLGRGAFDEVAIMMTAGVLFFFTFSIPFESLMHLLSRIYYAFHNTVIPVLINVLFLGINLGGSFYFSKIYGVKTFSVFFSVASFIQVTLLLLFLRRFVSLRLKFMFVRVLKILAASLVMGVVVYFLRDFVKANVWIRFVVSVLGGVVVYFALLANLDMIRYTGLKRFISILKK